MFSPVDQQPDLVALERRVLARWEEERTFQRSLEQRAAGPLWRFYEGPPTANGKPGVHHVEARVFKDLFPRYRTMKGFHVPRRGGWDCHGIPVELEVERQLGFTRKQDIEDYGVEAFNALCRQSVQTYVQDWNRLTERIGFWVDLDAAYWTMNPGYVESVWWSLASLWHAGLLYEGHRVVPYCPRCGTPLSDHEVAQGYAQARDPSVHVRFPLVEGPLAEADLLVWTTTPWTLISNTAVAIGPQVRYVLVRTSPHDRPVVMAAERVTAVLGERAEVLRDVAVEELQGLHYRGPFDYVGLADGRTASGAEATDWRYVTVQDFAVATEGTGIVHLAPAFGADDYAVGAAYGLPVINPVDAEGRFDARVGDLAGTFVKDADTRIIALLDAAGLLVSAGTYEHTYPFCWRCRTPLLYYAMPSWYVATTKLRDRLLEVNHGVDWHPEHIRDGRYGDWLANNVDWALSRTRYWGTPLPLWRCEDCSEITAVASRAELSDLAGRDLTGLDPHRPFVDAVTFACPSCKSGTARRVPDVIDAWYDSGAMPFAQLGYPHAPGSEESFAELFPADYICEAIDQTRGWFYSLMAISTLLFDQSSYRTVLCLGHIVDADGRKMSKSVGNIIDPWELIDAHGADALRWLLLTEGSPWVARRVGHGPLEEVVRRFLLTLWNSYYFFVTYARIDGWTPEAGAVAVGERPVMDRWLLAELAATVREVDDALEGFDSTGAGRALQRLVDDLSNWYIRRTRARFWAAEDSADKRSAFATLHEALVTVAALLAPFTPFVADELYANLVGSVEEGAPDSVHLLDFPVPDPAAADPILRRAMAVARRVVELGRRTRNDAAIGVRQPLPRALVALPPDDRDLFPTVAGIVAEELNVKAVTLVGPPAEGRVSGPVSYTVKPSFRALGKAFGNRTQAVAAAIAALDGEAVARALDAGTTVTVTVDGDVAALTPDMLIVTEEAREGWQVASDAGTSVALDLTVDAALRREGLARELVRALNDLRKSRDLALSDRIALQLDVDAELAGAVAEHGDRICRDVLALRLDVRPAVPDATALDVAGHRVWAALQVVEDEP